jgi:predicted MFS family arabinose efflux permease
MSIVADVATPGAGGRAYGWYATAHYGAIGVGPFIGGLVAQYGGHRAVFFCASVLALITLAAGFTVSVPTAPRAGRPGASFVEVRGKPDVWAGWLLAASGLLTQGIVFTFFPLLADQRGMTPIAIGLVFLVLGVANTAARIPAGWLVDRTNSPGAHAVAAVLVGAVATALLPSAGSAPLLLALVAVFGVAGGLAGVAIGVGLAAAAPSARGLVMGGYSTALYLGLALGSFAFGPLIARHGYAVGFEAGAAVATLGALMAAGLWRRRDSDTRTAGP